MGHWASQTLASSQLERVGSALLGKTWSAWDCSTEMQSGSQTTHTEFPCYVVQLEAVSTRVAPGMGNKGIKQGREKGSASSLSKPSCQESGRPMLAVLEGWGVGLTHCPPLSQGELV